MVFSLTDETYSLLCSVARPRGFTDRQWKLAFLFISLFNQCYWVAGSVIGAVMGQMIAFDTTGIEFAMTALYGNLRQSMAGCKDSPARRSRFSLRFPFSGSDPLFRLYPSGPHGHGSPASYF